MERISSSGCKIGIKLRRGSRQPMEVRDRDHALAFLSAHANGCAKRGQRYCHVRGMHSDALLARAKNRMTAMDSLARPAAAAGRSLVALGKCRIHEVWAARALEQVAAIRRQIAELWRSAGEDGLREQRIILSDKRMICGVTIPRQGSQPQPSIWSVLNVRSAARD